MPPKLDMFWAGSRKNLLTNRFRNGGGRIEEVGNLKTKTDRRIAFPSVYENIFK
jgi:hypothetical protein